MQKDDKPQIIVIAGPNGAGKSTTAPLLLPQALGIGEFVNADTIAQGLSAFQSDAVAVQAGRIMLARLHALAEQRASFAFETTLSTRGFAPWLAQLRAAGYETHLIFLSLPQPELATERVAQRVQAGGHHVPAETIRRRFRRGLENLFKLYMPAMDSWRFYDNSWMEGPVLIAAGAGRDAEIVAEVEHWSRIVETYADGR